jgi:hypothetical protein
VSRSCQMLIGCRDGWLFQAARVYR